MVGILAAIFIGNPRDYADTDVRRRYGMICGILGVVLNVMLCTAKFILGSSVGSVAMTADAFNNLSDAAGSVIQTVGFKMASKKPDREHPFGHGRMEYLAGLVIAFLILYMGVELVRRSFAALSEPPRVEFSVPSLLMMGAAVLVKLYIYLYNHSVGRKIGSVAMEATARDSLGDMAVSTVVAAGMACAPFTSVPVDAIGGMLVGLFVLKNGISSLKETVSPLLGMAATQEFVDRISEVALSHGPIIGVHDVTVHDYGPGRMMVSLHAEVPGDVDIFELHDALDDAEEDISRTFGCHAVIHMDPVDLHDGRLSELKSILVSKAEEMDPGLKVHDVRISRRGGRERLVFELMKPPEMKASDGEIRERILSSMASAVPDLECVIREIDGPYL